MEYEGKLYAKINGRYLEATISTNDFLYFIKDYNVWLSKQGYADADIICEFDWKDAKEFIKNYKKTL